MDETETLSVLVENISRSLLQIMSSLIQQTFSNQIHLIDAKGCAQTFSIVRKALLRLFALSKFFVAKSILLKQKSLDINFSNTYVGLISFSQNAQVFVYNSANQLRKSSNFTRNIVSPKFQTKNSATLTFNTRIESFPRYLVKQILHEFIADLTEKVFVAESVSILCQKRLPQDIKKLVIHDSFHVFCFMSIMNVTFTLNPQMVYWKVLKVKSNDITLPLSQKHYMNEMFKSFCATFSLSGFIVSMNILMFIFLNTYKLTYIRRQAFIFSHSFFRSFLRVNTKSNFIPVFEYWGSFKTKISNIEDRTVFQVIYENLEHVTQQYTEGLRHTVPLTKPTTRTLCWNLNSDVNIVYFINKLSGSLCFLVTISKISYVFELGLFYSLSTNQLRLRTVIKYLENQIFLNNKEQIKSVTVTSNGLIVQFNSYFLEIKMKLGKQNIEYRFELGHANKKYSLSSCMPFFINISDIFFKDNLFNILRFAQKDLIMLKLRLIHNSLVGISGDALPELTLEKEQLCLNFSETFAVFLTPYNNLWKVYPRVSGIEFSSWKLKNKFLASHSGLFNFDDKGCFIQLKQEFINFKKDRNKFNGKNILFPFREPGLNSIIKKAIFLRLFASFTHGTICGNIYHTALCLESFSESAKIVGLSGLDKLSFCIETTLSEDCCKVLNTIFDLFFNSVICMYIYCLQNGENLLLRFKELCLTFINCIFVLRDTSQAIMKQVDVHDEMETKLSTDIISSVSFKPTFIRGKKPIKLLEKKRSAEVDRSLEFIEDLHFLSKIGTIQVTCSPLSIGTITIHSMFSDLRFKIRMDVSSQKICFHGNGTQWGDKLQMLKAYTKHIRNGKEGLLIHNKRPITVPIIDVIETGLLNKLLT